MDKNDKKIVNFINSLIMIRRIFTAEPFCSKDTNIKKFLISKTMLKMIHESDIDLALSFSDIAKMYVEDLIDEASMVDVMNNIFVSLGIDEFVDEIDKDLNATSKMHQAMVKIMSTGGIHIDLSSEDI